MGFATNNPFFWIAKSKGNKTAGLLEFLNNNASVAINDNLLIPAAEKPFSTKKPKGFISINSGLLPPQLRRSSGPASLLGPVSIRPKMISTPEVPIPSKTAALPGGTSNRPKE
nr:hypothetical protein [Cyanobium sp. HWJ4-Hawea]